MKHTVDITILFDDLYTSSLAHERLQNKINKLDRRLIEIENDQQSIIDRICEISKVDATAIIHKGYIARFRDNMREFLGFEMAHFPAELKYPENDKGKL